MSQLRVPVKEDWNDGFMPESMGALKEVVPCEGVKPYAACVRHGVGAGQGFEELQKDPIEETQPGPAQASVDEVGGVVADPAAEHLARLTVRQLSGEVLENLENLFFDLRQSVAQLRIELQELSGGRRLRMIHGARDLKGLHPLRDCGLEKAEEELQIVFVNTPNLLVTGSFDATARVWDLQTGQPIMTIKRHDANSVVLHPSYKYLAVTVADDQWEIRKVPGNKTVYRSTGNRCSITSLAFSGNGSRLMVAAEDGNAHIFDTSGLNDLEEQSEAEVKVEPVKLLKVLKVPGQRNFIMTLGAISPCGNKAAVTASNNRVVVWDVPSGDMSAFEAQRVTTLAFSPDGTLLAAALRSGSALVCNLTDNSRREVKSGQKSEVFGLAFSPDQELMAMGCRSGAVLLFNVADNTLQFELEGHKSGVNALAFDQDGEHLATASDDCSVRLWSLAERRCTSELSRHHQAGICCVHLPIQH